MEGFEHQESMPNVPTPDQVSSIFLVDLCCFLFCIYFILLSLCASFFPSVLLLNSFSQINETFVDNFSGFSAVIPG